MKSMGNLDDRAPLLGCYRDQNVLVKQKRACLRWKVVSLGLITIFYSFLIVAIVISIVYVKPRLQDGVSQGVSFQLESFKLLGLNNDDAKNGGLLLNVKGQEQNHFDQINDSIVANWFRYGGAVIRGLELNVNDLTMTYVSHTNEFVDLGKAKVDPFYVKTFNDNATKLDLIVEYWPNSSGVGSILKQVTSHPFTKIYFKVNAVVEVYLINGFIYVGTIEVPLDLAFDPHQIESLNILQYIEL